VASPACAITTAPDIARTYPRQSRQAIILRLAALFPFEEREVIMVWFLALPIICVAAAAFMWRFERHLEELTGPWIPD